MLDNVKIRGYKWKHQEGGTAAHKTGKEKTMEKFDPRKDLIEARAAEWQSESMKKHIRQTTFACVEIGNGGYIAFDKKGIEKEFCFGESGHDFDEAQERARAAKSFEYFKQENLRELEKEKALLESDEKLFILKNNSERGYFYFSEYWADHYRAAAPREMTESERTACVAVLTAQIEDMEKRLARWWKRYGVDYIHTWTYWRDA